MELGYKTLGEDIIFFSIVISLPAVDHILQLLIIWLWKQQYGHWELHF